MAKARIERSDWRTAGIVDKAIDMLAIGTMHEEVNAFLRDRMVPVEVIRRVLAGFGVRRHHEKGSLKCKQSLASTRLMSIGTLR